MEVRHIDFQTLQHIEWLQKKIVSSSVKCFFVGMVVGVILTGLVIKFIF